jgi:hypothetical protein
MSSFCAESVSREEPCGESTLTPADVQVILNTMYSDQEEHQFFSFCPTYQKVRYCAQGYSQGQGGNCFFAAVVSA